MHGLARNTLETGDLCAQQTLCWALEAHSIDKYVLSILQALSRHREHSSQQSGKILE